MKTYEANYNRSLKEISPPMYVSEHGRFHFAVLRGTHLSTGSIGYSQIGNVEPQDENNVPPITT